MTSIQMPNMQSHILSILPLVKHYLDLIGVEKIIDGIVPAAPQRKVSHSNCVLAMLFNILHGDHRLYSLEERLEHVDLTCLFEKTGLTPDLFDDNRLGETLDAISPHTNRLYADIVISALKGFRIRPKRFHVDSTTIKLYGAYTGTEGAGIFGNPIPAYGFSKDHRPDLLQLTLGIVATEDGLPIIAHLTDGNKADTVLFREHMTVLSGMLDELRAQDVPLIGDSKLCTSETMVLAYDQGIPLLSLVPETWGVRKELVRSFCSEPDAPELLVTEDGDIYRGKSVILPYLVDQLNGSPRQVPLRFLLVHSSQLQAQKDTTRRVMMFKEQKALEALARRVRNTTYACEADARKAAKREFEKAKAKFHDMNFEIFTEQIETPRAKGRPRKDAPENVSTTVWVVQMTFVDKPFEISEINATGCFVLVTTIADRRRLSDGDLLRAYKEQQVVELDFKWLKGPLAVAPVFLKKIERIRALGFVLMIALLVLGLIQRQVRRGLAEKGVDVPYLDKKRTKKPTWNSILQLFQHIHVMTVDANGQRFRQLQFFRSEHQEFLDLLDLPNLYKEKIARVYD
jgi:transposase